MTGSRTRFRTARADAVDPSPEVKQRIFQAAFTLFGQKGYSGVSMREICRLAGASAPTVYYYFRSKRSLYQALLEESMRVQRDRLEEALKAEGDPLSRLACIVRAWLGLGAEPVTRELRLFYLREATGLGSELYKHLGEDADRSLRHAIRDVLQDGVRQGLFRPIRAEMVALTIIGIMNTFMRRVALGANLDPAEGLDQVMDVLMFGVVSDSARKRLRRVAQDGVIAEVWTLNPA